MEKGESCDLRSSTEGESKGVLRTRPHRAERESWGGFKRSQRRRCWYGGERAPAHPGSGRWRWRRWSSALKKPRFREGGGALAGAGGTRAWRPRMMHRGCATRGPRTCQQVGMEEEEKRVGDLPTGDCAKTRGRGGASRRGK